MHVLTAMHKDVAAIVPHTDYTEFDTENSIIVEQYLLPQFSIATWLGHEWSSQAAAVRHHACRGDRAISRAWFAWPERLRKWSCETMKRNKRYTRSATASFAPGCAARGTTCSFTDVDRAARRTQESGLEPAPSHVKKH